MKGEPAGTVGHPTVPDTLAPPSSGASKARMTCAVGANAPALPLGRLLDDVFGGEQESRG